MSMDAVTEQKGVSEATLRAYECLMMVVQAGRAYLAELTGTYSTSPPEVINKITPIITDLERVAAQFAKAIGVSADDPKQQSLFEVSEPGEPPYLPDGGGDIDDSLGVSVDVNADPTPIYDGDVFTPIGYSEE